MATALMDKAPQTKQRTGTLRSPLPTLRFALAAVEPAVPERSPTPVLRNVLLKDGRVHATNNEMWISVPSGISGPLETLVPFGRLKQIADMCRADDSLTFQFVGSALGIKASGGRWALPTEDQSAFPLRQGGDTMKPLARLPADQFHDLLKSAVIACAKDAGRYSLNGVLIEFNDGVLSFVGSDGRRMCVASCDIDQSLDNSSALVPRKAIDALIRLAALSGDERAVQLSTTRDSIVASFLAADDDEGEQDAIEFEAMLLAGPYPKWREAQKEYGTPPSRTPAGALLNAVEMCAVCTSETSRGITMTIFADSAKFKGSSSEHGKAESACGLSALGTGFSTTFDPRLAADWLAMLDPSEPVTISGLDAESPFVLESLNCRCVISPISKE